MSRKQFKAITSGREENLRCLFPDLKSGIKFLKDVSDGCGIVADLSKGRIVYDTRPKLRPDQAESTDKPAKLIQVADIEGYANPSE